MHDDNPASALNRLRWSRVSPAERSAFMRLVRRKGLKRKALKKKRRAKRKSS